MKKLFDLTYPQKSILLTEQFYKNTPVNDICGSVIINNVIDFVALKKAINCVVKNNDSFRIHLVKDNDEIKQYVTDFKEIDFEIVDIEDRNKIKDIEKSLINDYFSLYESDLFKIKIFRLKDNTGGFVVDIHHIISDGWTLGLIARKIMHSYSCVLNQITEDNVLEQSYMKYIETEEKYIDSPKFEKDRNYWEEKFSDIPNIINLPNSRRDVNTSLSCEGNRISYIIPKDKVKNITAFCDTNKVSVFNFFMSILSIYIYKSTDTNNFVIGTPILNRSNFNEKNTTGTFINIVPLKIDIENNFNFKEFVSKIALDSMSLLRHQRYPYAEILKYVRKQDLNFPTLFNILLSYQITRTNNESEFSYTTRWAFNGTCADDLDVQLYDLDETGELSVSYDYKISKYDKSNIEELHKKILYIMEQVISNPEIEIEDIELLSKEEKNSIVIDFNNTKTSYEKNKTIVELFEEQVQKNPNNVAVIFENNEITYSELNRKANQIANYLRINKKVKPGDFVSVLLNRSINLVVAILGIVKAGATYVAIDPEYPKDRIQYMLENCHAKNIFVNSNTKHIISEFSIDQIDINSELLYEDKSSENLEIVTKPEDLLYVIYTSGSTGTPKGVTIKNYNVHNFVVGMRKLIDFSQTKAMVSVATVCFDMFVFELWGTLLNGLKLVLANEDEQKLPTLLNKLCVENDVDIFQTTPSRFKLLFDNESTECFSKIKHILVGGEAVPEYLFKKFLNYENLNVHHMYGPTETTVWSTGKTITDCSNITIGTPIANTDVYILDKNKKVCQIGIPGEIYIAGDGVGNGYLYNEELNRKVFVENQFVPGTVMYKTGDSGFYTESGEIVYLNRIDNQIKIRGFRVELDEIEKNIFDFPNIKNCVVMKKTLPNGNETLCAYYISNLPIDVNNLKRVLQQNLPAYMIPQYFMKLEDFPYTPNGKIDRKNLPLPNLNKENIISVQTRNKIDVELIKILTELLNISSIQISDNLFELGMDSLTAISLAVRMQKEFDVNLSIQDIFNNPIIKDLSDLINKTSKEKVKITITKAENALSYPLSNAQKRMYYSSLVDGKDSILYNVSGGIIFNKLPNIQKLSKCMQKLLNTHESFRTHFEIENNIIVQKITDYVEFSLECEKAESNNIDDLFKEFIKPFDLEKAPLFRAKLMELQDGRCIFMIDIHHIICDGASLNILIKDLCNLYNSSELPVLNVTYKDYAVWEIEQTSSKQFKESEKYWLDKFNDNIPLLNLPTTYTRPATKTYNGNLIFKSIDNNVFNKIKNISKKYNVTPNIILLSAYYILLYKYTNQEDIIVGTPIIGRSLPELRNIIGMFVNTLPLRNTIHPNSLVSTFLKSVKENCAEAFSHQDYPFDTLVSKINASRDNSRNFLFDLLFTYQTNNYSNIDFQGLQTELYRPNNNTSKFDISLEVLPRENTYELTFEYCTNIFDEKYINKFAEHYINTINNIVDNIDSKISDISILSDEERNEVLYNFNNTAMQYNQNKTLAELFEEQVIKTPDNIAVIFEDISLTYFELNKKANQLAWYLNEINIGENNIVGIMLPRSLEVLICMLASLKAGITYIPIDPSLPEARIKYMLENSGATTVLTFDSVMEKVNNSKLNIDNIVDVNIKTSDIYSGRYRNLDLKINPESGAYIIYTSGSTGKPKGVALKQKALSNLTHYLNKNVKFLLDEYANIAIASITTISFDIFIFETLICLQHGLKVIIANEAEQNTPDLLDDLIEKYNVKCIQMTPSRMDLFYKNKEVMPHLSNLEYIVLAGEALPKELRDNILKLGNITIYNGYGPSETTVFSTFTDVTNQKEITIGKPLGNTQIYVLDKDLKPLPINKIGEVYIAGDGVGIEYINNEKITKERFINNPFLENSIMYKTGDLAKILPNGELSYAGRVDNQVKIRGLRIELDEIEKCILKYRNIDKCIISVKSDVNERQFVVAYLLISDRIYIYKLKEFLKEMLPQYMIPTYFIILDEIPYLPNGKIDKKALPAPDFKNKITADKYVAPKTKLEIRIANIFQNLLYIDPIGLHDNFFELGGDSLLAINLQIELSKIASGITYSDIFLNPTVYELAEKIKENKKTTSKDIIDSEFEKYNSILMKNTMLPNTINKTFSGNVLIAGTTGFLGAHILNEFLQKEDGIAYCIVRSESGFDIKEKLLKKLHYYFGRKYDHLIDNRIIIVNGDISKSDLDVSYDKLEKIFNNISCVINSAAKVAHYGKYESFKKINVDGVENLLKLCKKFNKKFYQISTVSVSGTNLTDKIETEDITFNESNLYVKQSLNNVYIKSKFEAEKLVLDYITDGVDAYIIRVGNLMNRISDMKFQPNTEENAFINRLVSFIKIGSIPEYLANEYLEFTPVDSCAEAIIKLIQYSNSNNRIFHLFNQKHIYLKQFIKVLSNYKKLKVISEKEFLKEVDEILNSKNSDKILSGIIKDFDSDKKIAYRSNVKVNNDFSNLYLKKIGFEWPDIDNNYLDKFINYILKF